MPIFDIYSKRRRRERGEFPDVFQYEHVSDALKVQVIKIFDDVSGESNELTYIHGNGGEFYKGIHDIISRELGVDELNYEESYRGKIVRYLEVSNEIDLIFDVFELGLNIIDLTLRYESKTHRRVKIKSDQAIEEFNHRFKEAGLGYEYVNRMLIRIDSEYLHKEAIKPALEILSDALYQGANQEFRAAFESYKEGDNKSALVNALKAFESVLKSICDKRGWNYSPTDTASKLIKCVLDNGILPTYMQNNLDSVRTLLESVATPRNKMGGHGQGSGITSVPDYFASFALNMTASSIILLASSEKSMP